MPTFSQSLKNAERLEVTVIPVDDEPYSKIIQIPHALLGKQIESLDNETMAIIPSDLFFVL